MSHIETKQESGIRRSIDLLADVARDIKLFLNPHLSPPASSLVMN